MPPTSIARESPLQSAQSSSSTPRRPSASSFLTQQAQAGTLQRSFASWTVCRLVTSTKLLLLSTGFQVMTLSSTPLLRPRTPRPCSLISELLSLTCALLLFRKFSSYETLSRHALT
ncbi:peroxiredoxin-6 [Alternaria alternata]|nr:peroxiredoxin-6 [Alternaria alternata]